MKEFPRSSGEIREYAEKLVDHLRKGIKNTSYQEEWSAQNFRLLHEFARWEECDSYSHYHQYEYLWDFSAFIHERGMLLAAESEWDPNLHEIQKDFCKLLYPRSPLKLMICRIDVMKDSPEEALEKSESIRENLEHFLSTECRYFSPGEAFILYCVWWAREGDSNRDIPYILQMSNEPRYQFHQNERFERCSALD